MIDETRSALANARLQQARQCLRYAEIGLEMGEFKGAANRSYYCIFHAIRALLALDGIDFKRHSGVITAFRQRYTKTAIFAANFSDIVGDAFEIRNESDYQDFYIVPKERIETQIANAKIFLSAVEEYIAAKLPPS